MPSPKVTERENENVKIVENLSVDSLSLASESTRVPPLRPGYSTIGKAIELYANHFELSLDLKINIYRYDVEIVPEVKINRMKRRLFELLLADNYLGVLPNPPASNYENMVISNKKLDLGVGDFKTYDIEYYNRGERAPSPSKSSGPSTRKQEPYKVRVTYSGVLQTDRLVRDLQLPPTAPGFEDAKQTLEGLNSALTINASLNPGLKSTCQSSKFFITGGIPYDLGDCVVALKGYYTSIHTATLRLLVNANVCTSAFYQEGNLCEIMQAYKRKPDGTYKLETGRRFPALEQFIEGLRVKTQYTKSEKLGESLIKERTVVGFSHILRDQVENGTATQISFVVAEWGNLSVNVAEYFKRKYGITARLDVPVINLGSEKRPLWVPAELCTVIAGQPCGKLDPDQTAKMTKYGVMRPADSARSIVNNVPDILGLDLNRANHESLRSHG